MARRDTLREKLEELKEKGEVAFDHLTEEIRRSPGFVKAVEGARKGQRIVEDSVKKAIKRMDAPTREEFEALVTRVESLERRVSRIARAKPAPPPAARKTKTPARRRV